MSMRIVEGALHASLYSVCRLLSSREREPAGCDGDDESPSLERDPTGCELASLEREPDGTELPSLEREPEGIECSEELASLEREPEGME